jgi:phospholipid/cholesterol/gamma-HCH transport system ATP-binding protein
MITHDLDTLFRICNRAGVIVDGRMITGTLAELLENQNPWIHDYFHGPRARAAVGTAPGGPAAGSPAAGSPAAAKDAHG